MLINSEETVYILFEDDQTILKVKLAFRKAKLRYYSRLLEAYPQLREK